MALKPCRECKTKVSSEAKTCPYCGISKPVKSNNLGTIILAIIIFPIFIVFLSSEKNDGAITTQKPSIKQNKISQIELKVELNANVVGNNRNPIIKLKSNLPEGTSVSVNIFNPINKGGSGYSDGLDASISAAKTATVGPFSQNGKPLSSGFYIMDVSVTPLMQPESVQSIIGKNGENMKGNDVFKFKNVSIRIVSQRYAFELTQDGGVVNFVRTENSEAYSSLEPVE